MKSQWQYKTAIDKPVNSIGGFLDKVATKFGLYDIVGGSSTVGKIKQTASALLNNPSKFFIDSAKGLINKSNFQLNKNGTNYVNQRLFTMGINPSQYTRNLFVKSFVFQDESSLRAITSIAKKSRSVDPYNRNRVRREYW